MTARVTQYRVEIEIVGRGCTAYVALTDWIGRTAAEAAKTARDCRAEGPRFKTVITSRPDPLYHDALASDAAA